MTLHQSQWPTWLSVCLADYSGHPRSLHAIFVTFNKVNKAEVSMMTLDSFRIRCGVDLKVRAPFPEAMVKASITQSPVTDQQADPLVQSGVLFRDQNSIKGKHLRLRRHCGNVLLLMMGLAKPAMRSVSKSSSSIMKSFVDFASPGQKVSLETFFFGATLSTDLDGCKLYTFPPFTVENPDYFPVGPRKKAAHQVDHLTRNPRSPAPWNCCSKSTQRPKPCC